MGFSWGGVPKIQNFPNSNFELFPNSKKSKTSWGKGGGANKIVNFFHFLWHFFFSMAPLSWTGALQRLGKTFPSEVGGVGRNKIWLKLNSAKLELEALPELGKRWVWALGWWKPQPGIILTCLNINSDFLPRERDFIIENIECWTFGQ